MSCNKNKSRFCYNYTPQKLTTYCCKPIVCTTNEYISTISSMENVINNNTRTTEQSLLLATQQKYLQDVQSTNINSTIQYTITNSTIISNNIYSQLLQVRNQRYEPYQPYVPPMIPSSVIQLQMNTANAGVPMSFFTIMDCKGSQSVTT